MSKLPNGWKKQQIGDIASLTSGGTPSRGIPEYWGGNIPWITTSSINFQVITEANEFITEEGLLKSSAKLFPVNTILMAMYGQGETRGRVGILGIEATTNQACAAIQVNSEHNFLYVYYWLVSQYLTIRELSHGGSQKNLNQSLIESIPVLTPPLPEQKAIAQILSTWDAAISLVEQLIAALQTRKRGLMQKLLTGVVRFPGFDGDWEERNLIHLTENGIFIDGDWVESKDQDLNGDVRLIQLADIGDGIFLNKSNRFMTSQKVEELNGTYLQTGDILVARMPDPIGRASMFPEIGIPCVTVVDICIVRPDNTTNSYWLMYNINSADFRQEIVRRATGTTRTRIARSKLGAIYFVTPKLEEQNAIADFLLLLDEELRYFTLYRDHLQTQKRGLMQRLLTGEVRVKV